MSSDQYQPSIFETQRTALGLYEADVEYWPEFYSVDESHRFYKQLIDEVDWQQDRVTVYGKEHLAPRLSRWFGEPWMDYTYASYTMKASAMTSLLKQIQANIEQQTGERFNSVLVNYYRDGSDSNGWHSDDEPELGNNPIIASLSLGASRDFHLRHKRNKEMKHKMSLENGSLLMMRGTTQSHWQHHVPKRANADGRINLTFRTILKP